MECGDPYMWSHVSITRLLLLPPTSVHSVEFQLVAGIKTLLVSACIVIPFLCFPSLFCFFNTKLLSYTIRFDIMPI